MQTLFRKIYDFTQNNSKYGLEVSIKNLSTGEPAQCTKHDMDEITSVYQRYVG